jgi:tRNA (cytidine/uridine-2'-O-)-methyltransferase
VERPLNRATDRNAMALHIALIEPQIPPNTGNIARLCVATDSPLHLIEPLGFSLEAGEVRRAGLEYWDRVDLWVHPNWFRFRDAITRDRCLYFSANADRDYREARFEANSVLVFGNETDGLPAKILEKHPEQCFKIPMPGDVRSLNLANAVSVVLYEGLNRLGLTPPGEAAPPPDRAAGRKPSSRTGGRRPRRR